MTFLDAEYKEKDVEVEAQKTVKGQYPDTYQGGYEHIGEVNAAVAAWIEANGYRYAGPMFNIYHVSPHETRNPDEFVTEVCYPITK